MTWNVPMCWRCRKVPVRCYGVTCLKCRAVLHRAYDKRKAANGGRLLYIPDDWDGPARPAETSQQECSVCHDWYSVKQQNSRSVRCPECQHDHILAGVHAYRAQRRAQDPPKRMHRTTDLWDGFGEC